MNATSKKRLEELNNTFGEATAKFFESVEFAGNRHLKHSRDLTWADIVPARSRPFESLDTLHDDWQVWELEDTHDREELDRLAVIYEDAYLAPVLGHRRSEEKPREETRRILEKALNYLHAERAEQSLQEIMIAGLETELRFYHRPSLVSLLDEYGKPCGIYEAVTIRLFWSNVDMALMLRRGYDGSGPNALSSCDIDRGWEGFTLADDDDYTCAIARDFDDRLVDCGGFIQRRLKGLIKARAPLLARVAELARLRGLAA